MDRPPLIELPFHIVNASGDTIRGDLRYPEGKSGAPVLIVCHGFTAHKDWGPFPHCGRRFAECGFVSVVFNFSHNGVGADPRRFTETGKFARNTIGKELEDVRALVGALGTGSLARGIAAPSRIGIVGHSRGGGVAILSADALPEIGGVAAWSSVATFRRYTEHQRHAWERDGFLPVTIRGMRTKLRFDLSVLRDLEAHADEYDLLNAVAGLRVPLLLVHGSADVSVKPAEAEALHRSGDPSRTELVMLEGEGHMFGAAHPFRPERSSIDRVIDITARWFHRNLS
jgi:dienelactone hydrolase